MCQSLDDPGCCGGELCACNPLELDFEEDAPAPPRPSVASYVAIVIGLAIFAWVVAWLVF